MNLINILEAKNIKPKSVEIGEDVVEFSSNADIALGFDGFRSNAIGYLITNREFSSMNLSQDELNNELFQTHIARTDKVGHELRVKFITAISSNTSESKLKKIYKNVSKSIADSQGECNIDYAAFVHSITQPVMQSYLSSQADAIKKLRDLEELRKVAK